MREVLVTIIVWIIALSVSTTGAEETALDRRTGTIKGRVVDAARQLPLVGVTVRLLLDNSRTQTDSLGEFLFEAVPAGTHAAEFRCIGYRPRIRTDIVTRVNRTTAFQVELEPAAVAVDDIVVRADYFSEDESLGGGATSFYSEEIRRAPGAVGDVSRILSTLPSVAQVSDLYNSLPVRGGHPMENGFYVDDIPIPNINHYPLMGSSGGPIGLINVDFIREVDFSAGGFGVGYGDHLASVIDIDFREGNGDEFDGQLDLTISGLGAVAEGPLAGGAGNWMASSRFGFLDAITEAASSGFIPRFHDHQAKVTYNLTPSDKLSVLAILGQDRLNISRGKALEEGFHYYGVIDGYEYAVGLNWRHLLGGSGYATTTVSLLGTKYGTDFDYTKNQQQFYLSDSKENTAQIRSQASVVVAPVHTLTFGLNLEHQFSEYDIRNADRVDEFGRGQTALSLDDCMGATVAAVHGEHRWQPTRSVSLAYGLRFERFPSRDRVYVSPRGRVSWDPSSRLRLSLSGGVYRQQAPTLIAIEPMAEDEYYQQFLGRDSLMPLYSRQVVASARLLLADDAQLKVEAYHKAYRDFPQDRIRQTSFLVDQIGLEYFENLPLVVASTGRAESNGLELTLQKRLVKGFYGLLTAAWSSSRYEDQWGKWRPRAFDNRGLVAVSGGYKPSPAWEFSARWIYAGGQPYSPVDPSRSELWGQTILDFEQVNMARFPDYHSLNIRVDRRFSFSGSNLAVYLSIWNLYDRRNVFEFYWNIVEEREDAFYQWGIIPLIGLEYEF